MCKKQQYLQLYKISTRVFVFYTIPPVCRKRRPPSKSLGNGWKLLLTTSRHYSSVRNDTAPDDFNVMEWDILMAITAEDMTSNTLQQRMIPKKTQTKTLAEILYN